MSEIKSKRAKECINSHLWRERDTCPLYNVRAHIAEEAIIIAEQEAEERHEQQLKELRDRAVEAFCHVKCFGSRESRCADCLSLKVFTQKLTEKQ